MPHEIDIEAGKLLRFARQQRRMSQDQLAKEIGVTFQQIQKYEKGRNRMGASKIWEFSQALSVPPGYFFPTTNHAAPKLSKEDLETGKKFIQDHFSFLYQADGSLSTLESIMERMKVAVMRHGVRGVVIDPYNYISRDAMASETDWISDMLTNLRVFAQAHGIHIWFVAHPTKMMRDADGNVPPPKGYDISGSAAWFAKADVGITVHRSDESTDIHCWKMRFKWLGKQGAVPLSYDVVSGRYSDYVDQTYAGVSEGHWSDDF